MYTVRLVPIVMRLPLSLPDKLEPDTCEVRWVPFGEGSGRMDWIVLN